MDAADAAALRKLVATQPLAALGTLHEGREGAEPMVSMTPVAWLPGATALVHVSSLAPHTRDLLRQPRASLMLLALPATDDDPQARPRLTIQVEAEFLARDGAAWAGAEATFRARFPRSSQTFALADFHLVALKPRSARFVAGFGRAHGLAPAALAGLLAQP